MAAINIQRYIFSEQDRLFFDTNIWFFIYGPQSKLDGRQRIYSNAFHSIISNGGKIYIDILVLAEFINRVARFHYDIWCDENQSTLNYKEFRSSENFKSIAKEIEIASQMILLDSTQIETGFTKINISSLLTSFVQKQQDFNDLVIENICQINQLKLVTEDRDFKGTNIQILTSNRKLLQ
jgi:predicted nucleic acid-binding protein